MVEKIGDFRCGNGCKYQIRFEQLSPMEEIGGGWRKVKLIKRTFFWNHELQKFEKKGFRDPPKHPFAGSWRGWNYANCTSNQFTFGSVNYLVEPSPPIGLERNPFVVLIVPQCLHPNQAVHLNSGEKCAQRLIRCVG